MKIFRKPDDSPVTERELLHFGHFSTLLALLSLLGALQAGSHGFLCVILMLPLALATSLGELESQKEYKRRYGYLAAISVTVCGLILLVSQWSVGVFWIMLGLAPILSTMRWAALIWRYDGQTDSLYSYTDIDLSHR